VWLVVLTMAAFILVAALPGDPTFESWPESVFFSLLLAWLLLRGSGLIRRLLIVIYAVGVIGIVAAGPWPWEASLAAVFAICVIGLIALLARPSRDWTRTGHDTLSRRLHA
jgi:hypothetical protein